MSVVTSTSIKEVIARIIRTTRVQDTLYISNLDEWIPEAMGILKTRAVLANRWQDIDIEFHKGKTPIDCKKIKAVEWNHHRLKKSNQAQTVGIPLSSYNNKSPAPLGTTNGFEYVPQFYDTPVHANKQENSIIFTQDLISTSVDQCNNFPCHDHHWYDTELDYILTSIPNGKLRIHYRAIPVDEDGFPLIPDNEDYKMAVYFYCRAQMIAAGWEDKIFNYDKIMLEEAGRKGYFWTHAERALASIRYPSTDEMELKVWQMTRLVKDEGWFDRFFSTDHEEKRYGYDEYAYNTSPGGGDAKTYLTSPGNHSQG